MIDKNKVFSNNSYEKNDKYHFSLDRSLTFNLLKNNSQFP